MIPFARGGMVKAGLLLLAALSAAALTGCSSASEPPPAPTASESEKADLLDQRLSARWNEVAISQPLGAAQPDVEVIRFIPQSERSAVVGKCMQEAGYEIESSGSGSDIELSGTEAQWASQQLALYICDAQYPIDPANDLPLTDDELRYLYDYLAGSLRECLSGVGFETSSPPSFQAFKDQYDTDPWSPWGEAADSQSMTQPEFDELNAACPQVPPGLRGN